MDLFRKMFEKSGEKCKDSDLPETTIGKPFGNEFKKPMWFDDCETDDELYDGNKASNFLIFANPLEMQRHFERQMQEMLKQFDDGKLSESLRDEYLKPGFEQFFTHKDTEQTFDRDLDGEIYVDQLHSLLKKIPAQLMAPENKLSSSPNSGPTRRMKSDEEKIMDLIHGFQSEENKELPIRRKSVVMPKMPGTGVPFDGSFQGIKSIGRSIVTQTIRRPDGTYETRRTISDGDGNTKTTMTRTKNGEAEVVTSFGNANGEIISQSNSTKDMATDRNMTLKNGYAMPKNIW